MKDKINISKQLQKPKVKSQVFNTNQSIAISSNDKRLLIQAGPGTGKSATLLGIVENLINKGVRGENMQMITFTRSGVQNLRERISEFSNEEISINTFHSFALSIIKDNKQYFKDKLKPISDIDNLDNNDDINKQNFRFLIDDFDSLYTIKNCYENLYEKLKGLKTSDKNFYLKSIQKEIKDLKLKGITPESYPDIIESEYNALISAENSRLGKNGKLLSARKSELEKIEKIRDRKIDLQLIYKDYRDILLKNGKMDFDDVIPVVTTFLEDNKNIAAGYQNKIGYILVDEYQDTNHIQEKLINIINPEYIRYVGDEKQAIFGFQGASSENIMEKIKTIPTIPLSDNYRSGQEILNFSDSIYRSNIDLLGKDGYVPVSLKSMNGVKSDVKIISFNGEYEEIFFIKEKIKKMISDGVKESDIAVIYRNNSHGLELGKLLSDEQIKFNYSLDSAVFKKGKTKFILNTIISAFNGGIVSKKQLFESLIILCDNKNLENFFYDLNKKYKKTKIDTNLNDFIIEHNNIFKKYPDVSEGVNKLIGLMENAKRSKRVSEVIDLLPNVINYSFVEDEFLGNEKIKNDIKSLKDFIVSCEVEDYSIGNVLNKIIFAQNIEYSTPSKDNGVDGVKLMTAHKSKGLEFENVFVIKNHENTWTPRNIGNFFGGEGKDKVEDLNLFYVALTRAKKQVYLTYSKDKNGKQTSINSLIPEDIILKTGVTDVDKNISIANDQLKTTDVWKEWGEDLSKNLKLSYSALNKYFISPDNFRFEYLLGLKDLPTKNMVWGIATHSMIKARNKTKGTVDNDGLKTIFESEIQKYGEYIDKNDILEMEGKLSNFISLLPGLPNQDYAEAKITANINGIDIEGYLDGFSIENGEIVISDYKSGKVKTDSEILKSGEYEYKGMIAQLYFYKILLENMKDFSYNNSIVKLPVNKVTKGRFIYFSEDGLETKDFDLNDIYFEDDIKNDILKMIENIKGGYLGKMES